MLIKKRDGKPYTYDKNAKKNPGICPGVLVLQLESF